MWGRLKTKLYHLRPDHIAWFHAKAALIVWAVLFYIHTPDKVTFALGSLLAAGISLAVVLGIGISVVGLFRSMSLDRKKSMAGTNMELAGLWIAIAGPASYTLTQFFLSFEPDSQRTALVAFAYANCALLAVRIVLVAMHRKRGM